MENIILSTDDDITEFTDEEQVKVRFVNIELKQKCWKDGEKREFMIFNGKQCYQKVEYKKGGKKKFRVNLSYLNAIPEREIKLAYTWYGFAAAMFVLTGVLVYGMMNKMLTMASLPIGLSVVAAILGVTALVYGYAKSSCRITFFSHYGKAPILEVIDGSPNNKSFVTFIDVLQQKINSYNQPKDCNTRQYLIDELAELRRLRNESVISSSVFNAAMKRIVKNQAYKV